MTTPDARPDRAQEILLTLDDTYVGLFDWVSDTRPWLERTLAALDAERAAAVAQVDRIRVFRNALTLATARPDMTDGILNLYRALGRRMDEILAPTPAASEEVSG